MESVWPDGRLDLSQQRNKAQVATGYTRFQSGDVLVPKITPTFEAARSILMPHLPTQAGAGTTELHILRPGPMIGGRYLAYITNSVPFLRLGEAEMYGVAGQKRVPDDFVRDYVVDLPGLDEQQRIADFLDGETSRIDQLRSMRVAQVEALEMRELSLILEAFTGSDRVQPAKRTPWPWLSEIPTEWRIGPVYAYFSTDLGKMLNTARITDDHQARYLRNANVHWYEINTDDLASMSFEPDERRRYSVAAGDLLVCEGGAGVAEAAVWDGRITPCYFQKSLHRVRQIKDVPVEWLMYWLRLAKHVGQFDAEGNLSTIPHLTGEQLRALRLPIPPDSARRVHSLDEDLQALFAIRDLLGRAQNALAERRQALITAAVTGQFDVATAQGVDVL